MGYPLDGSPYDAEPKCDSLKNPFGGGLDYCFSRNGDYTLVTGVRADAIAGRPTMPGASCPYITGSNFKDSFSELVGPVPAYFVNGAGSTYTISGQTKHPSDHLNKLDYYIPYTDFSDLIGCPLNGTWVIRVHDQWGIDNGWVFNWSMDICGVTQDDDCKYTVGIDSLIWRPNPAAQYHDYDLGHYRGLEVKQITPTLSHIMSPDTAGTFPIDVLVYDEFGCVWDTNTRITTYWTPEPNLGNDTTLCGVNQTVLDASDRHSATEHSVYAWSPFGENTPQITTHFDPGRDIDYVVRVYNDHGLRCFANDTIHVVQRKQPLPNFIPEPFSFEGCAPMTITFNNNTIDGDSYFWDFGDGITSELENPTHTYAEGVYTLKYYATSDEGCVDSVISKDAIAVYPKPKASFEWTPVYPSVMNPVVSLVNNTDPKVPTNKYYWEMQYNRDNPLSVQTYTTENLTYNFAQYANDGEVSGSYGVRLIARNSNIAPSGNLIQCADTAANTILVINDFLQFPNVVSPNGDGINDRFVIQNLVEGMGYPINTLDIYNKWGSRVYHKENISKDEDFWNPEGMPTGTYFYRFSAKGYNGNIEHNGAIEVVE
jgi:gliding motility-associated-like protein